MRAAIYNPYLDTLGGGERYSLSFAQVLTNNGYTVDIEWKDPKIKDYLEDRFGMDLKNINIVSSVNKGENYDLCFWVSDGSIPLMHARQNILHFQVPFRNVGGRSLINRMKFYRINKIICNSKFTKEIIDKEFGINSLVIYPPVDTISIKPKHKENLILYVGRFSKMMQSKGQDVLISAFKKLYDHDFHDWKLVLAGGVENGISGDIEELKKNSLGYPIKIFEGPDFKTLLDLYGRAKIFWSASGYGKDEMKEPEKMEHFGITVVEAMAAGAVPVIYDGGGHKEIIEDSYKYLLWKRSDELIDKTMEIIDDKKQLHAYEKYIISRSKHFSYENFEKNVNIKILQK